MFFHCAYVSSGLTLAELYIVLSLTLNFISLRSIKLTKLEFLRARRSSSSVQERRESSASPKAKPAVRCGRPMQASNAYRKEQEDATIGFFCIGTAFFLISSTFMNPNSVQLRDRLLPSVDQRLIGNDLLRQAIGG